MTDREMLEWAAKAAGLTLADPEDSYIPSGGLWIVGAGGRDLVWDPLHDDAAALRLAVILRFDLITHTRHGMTYAGTQNRSSCSYVDHDEDPYAATRRAIVLAAAVIGQAIPPDKTT